MGKIELNMEQMEKVIGGGEEIGIEKIGREDRPAVDRTGDNANMIRKCKYELKWTRQQYLDWCRSQGAGEAEIAAASVHWDSV